MIAVDTSAIIAVALAEPEAEELKTILRQEILLIGWPTLFETRIVLATKGFSNARDIVSRLADASNVTAVMFDEKHYTAAENAFDRFGKGRHPAALNMGDCFSYAVAAVAEAALLFKGQDFGRTDILCHPGSTIHTSGG